MRYLPRLMVWCGILCVISFVTAAESQTTDIKLPKPALTGNKSLEAAILHKKSSRNFTGSTLSLAHVSQLLWSANGNLPLDAVTSATTKVFPSAGGLNALEAFLVAGQNTVEGVPAGVYRYNPADNTLRQIAPGDQRNLLAHAALSQVWIARAPAIIVIAGVFERMTGKYGGRGMQYVFMEAGSANQNVFLQAESLGLKAASVGAFQDNQVAAALKLPAGMVPLLLLPVGN